MSTHVPLRGGGSSCTIRRSPFDFQHLGNLELFERGCAGRRGIATPGTPSGETTRLRARSAARTDRPACRQLRLQLRDSWLERAAFDRDRQITDAQVESFSSFQFAHSHRHLGRSNPQCPDGRPGNREAALNRRRCCDISFMRNRLRNVPTTDSEEPSITWCVVSCWQRRFVGIVTPPVEARQQRLPSPPARSRPATDAEPGKVQSSKTQSSSAAQRLRELINAAVTMSVIPRSRSRMRRRAIRRAAAFRPRA